MSINSATLQKVFQLIEPVCNAAGFELVDLRYLLDQGGWVLRVCIERLDVAAAPLDPENPPKDAVDTSDCEAVSRELSALLDVQDPIPGAFVLEVSSPGIDRPLRTPAHFRKYAGSETKLTMATPFQMPDGTERRNFRGIIEGVSADDASALLRLMVDKQLFELRIADIDQARVVPDWDAVMRGKSGVGRPPLRGVDTRPGKTKREKSKAAAATPTPTSSLPPDRTGNGA